MSPVTNVLKSCLQNLQVASAKSLWVCLKYTLWGALANKRFPEHWQLCTWQSVLWKSLGKKKVKGSSETLPTREFYGRKGKTSRREQDWLDTGRCSSCRNQRIWYIQKHTNTIIWNIGPKETFSNCVLLLPVKTAFLLFAFVFNLSFEFSREDCSDFFVNVSPFYESSGGSEFLSLYTWLHIFLHWDTFFFFLPKIKLNYWNILRGALYI